MPHLFGAPSGRPHLRGWLHGATVPVALAGVWLLARGVSHLPTLERLPVMLYGLAVVTLFSVSAVYHIPPRWRPTARARLLRLDGTETVLLIVCTFVPVAAYVLDGAWRRWSLVAALFVAAVGVTMATSEVTLPPRASASPYVVAAGWLAAIPSHRFALVLPWPGLLLIVLGGVLRAPTYPLTQRWSEVEEPAENRTRGLPGRGR